MLPIGHGIRREGLFVGLVGGTAVAVWFLFVDAVAGVPLYTPIALGAALFGVDPATLPPGLELLLAVGYTVFHFTAFAVVGTMAVALTHLAEREPVVLALFVILFVMFEMGFYGLVAVLHETRLLNGLEWYQIALGNLLASTSMGGYLWYSHPSLRPGMNEALSH